MILADFCFEELLAAGRTALGGVTGLASIRAFDFAFCFIFITDTEINTSGKYTESLYQKIKSVCHLVRDEGYNNNVSTPQDVPTTDAWPKGGKDTREFH